MIIRACFGLVLAAAIGGPASAGVEAVRQYYRADKPFPEFTPLWFEGWGFTDAKGGKLIYAKPDMPLGGYLYVHFRNTGPKPVKVTDLRFEGVKMSEALAKTKDTAGQIEGHSILASSLPGQKIELLKKAGHPVWWKAEPSEVLPGQMGQVVVRMRRQPQISKVNAVIDTNAGSVRASISVAGSVPHFESINFSEDLKTVWLYPRHPKPDTAPATVLMDGRDVTSDCTIAADRNLRIAPIVLKLGKPLEMMSYHCFEAVYPDGSAAAAGIRAWGNELVYGLWGERGPARAFYEEMAAHNMNAHMGHAGKEVMEMSLSNDGLEFLKKLGIRNMATWYGNARNTLFYFLQDEPDAQDPGIDDLPPDQRLGLCGQWLVKRMNDLRAKDPRTPILLNIDNTYKPENWYMYHQLADIPCLDPYYQGELDFTYLNHPGAMSVHYKPDYVYAAVAISQTSAAPKPLHVILCSTRYSDKARGVEGRFPTPEEARVQVYYALGAGAKGLSYWWFTPAGECYGCGADEPAAKALWTQIGLLGAEVRTAGPIITSSCPADIPVEGSLWLRARTLVSGTDTVAVVATNDNMLCDRVGTVYEPIENAKIAVTLPEWLNPKDVFEISCDGVSDVSWKKDGQKAALELGRVELSKLVVITADTKLRGRLSALYSARFAANVAKLKEQR